MLQAVLETAHKGLSDAEIARRVATGDEDAFHLLMRRHNQTLYRTARSILKDDAEAEDAVQESYLLAYRAMGTFRGDAKLSTWLTRIVVNEAISRSRKRNRTAEIICLDSDRDSGYLAADHDARNDDMREDTSDQPEAGASRAETRRLLEKKIDELPDAFRTVFVLRAVEEMTAEETALALGIPDATVRTRFFRAKGLLRESLAREIDFTLEDTFAFDGARCDRIVAGVLLRLRGMRNKLP
ncbi:MAG: RNA polymerase sigma factor [Betaproteobacteria bacterium]